MRLTRRILAGLLSAVLLLGASDGALAAGAGGELTLGIYFTTDLYGKWYSVDSNTGKSVEESYLKAVSALAGEEKKNDARLLIDAGNSLAGPSTTYRMNLERGEGKPIALSLRYAGYDAFFPGTAERSLSKESRKALYDSLTDPAGTLSGSSVAVLQAEREGEEQEERTAPYLVRGFLVNGREFRVGLVSLEEQGDWQELRRRQSCDLMVAVVPSGTQEGTAADMVARTAGLDLILMNGDGVSGVISLRDSLGRRVPVVRGGGKTLTRTEILVKEEGTFSVGKTESLELSSRRNDDNLGVLLAPYYEAAQYFGAQELGTLSGDWDWETDHSCVQSDTMNLIHEAQLWAAQAEVSIAAPLTQGFCIRQLLEEEKAALLTRRTCNAIYPDENDRLLAVEMTGEELKAWLENSAEGYTLEEDGITAGEGISQAYGISYTVCLGNPAGSRVVNMTFRGEPVTPDQVFRVAVSEESLTKAGKSYPVLWEAAREESFRTLGGSVTWILGEYIRSQAAGYKQITPPKAKSGWSVVTTSGRAAMTPVTRLGFVEALNAAMGSPKARTRCAFFSDIHRSTLDLTALDWAVEQGIVQGNGGGLFNPNAPISREQAAIMLLRFDLARNRGPLGSWAVAVPYTDATEISAWASEAVMWNVIRGYIPEDDGGNFRPGALLTTLELEGILEKLGG